MKKKSQHSPLIAAASALAAGMVLESGLRIAARKFDQVNSRYSEFRAGSAIVIGAPMMYFGKTPWIQSAGAGMLGMAGSSLATKFIFTPKQPANVPAQGTVPRQLLNVIKQEAIKRNAMEQVTQPSLNANTLFNFAYADDMGLTY
jgi:hypothetical protein